MDEDLLRFEWPPEASSSLEVMAASAAMLSYCDDTEIRTHLAGAENTCIHSVENALAVSWIQDKVWTVAVRGTELEDWRDLVDDVDLRLTHIYWAESARGHTGFLRHFDRLQSSLLSSVLKLPLDAIERVVFTGHSLGGATAYLAAFFFLDVLRAMGYTGPVEVRTFGAPKIGDEGLRLWCAQRFEAVNVVSYVNSCDAVPKVPPEMAENWSSRTVTFKTEESVLVAHHMSRYLHDVILTETYV
jgi:pimeloyl-ACP methyl ester carboxylesterase